MQTEAKHVLINQLGGTAIIQQHVTGASEIAAHTLLAQIPASVTLSCSTD